MIGLAVLIVGFLKLAMSEETQPTVCLDQNNRCMVGRLMNDLDGEHYEAFLGIPFAQPPIGELRFANPVEHEGWTGVYNATAPKNVCIQLNPEQGVVGSEDCLYLNIYRPKNIAESLPVIVFIHGGAFVYGSALPSVYGAEKLMSNGSVILVTLQYRVGALGFLSTGDCNAPGNVGLKDQSLALRWVKQNIGNFDGNPDRVTLAGESAGGVSVQLHMMSPLSEGLFQQAIMMSGSALVHTIVPPDMSIRLARYQAAAIGIRSAAEMSPEQIVTALRSADASAIAGSILAVKNMYNPFEAYSVFRPVVETCVGDQAFMVSSPYELWRKGEYVRIPWMGGFEQNEGTVLSLPILINQTIVDLFNSHASYTIPQFVGLNTSAAGAIKDRFFAESPSSAWISEANGQQFTDMINEAGFQYPLQCSARLHLSRGKCQPPITLFYFNFKGPYSYCSLYAPHVQRNFGVCHGDILMYLFRQPALFPDLVRNSPAANMSRKVVNFFVEFAHKGFVKCRKCCQSLNQCRMTEFRNVDGSDGKQCSKIYVDTFNEDMVNFWSALYNESCTV